MSLIPDTKVGKIEFAENHVDPWTTNSVPMGSSAPAVTSWSALVTAARAAYVAQQAAQLAAKDATVTLDLAIKSMMESTASIIKQVRAKADLVGDSVYALASLPVPATPSPKPAPGKPTALVVSLDETGALELAWKCANPAGSSGTIYQVWRQVGESAAPTYLGGTGTKKFVDSTLPGGSTLVVYTIQAVRSTASGPVATFNVRFGVGGGGMAMVASVTEATPTSPKIAA
jgi:hypothetical protein